MIEAAIAAAAVICEVYERPHVATAKADGSPVTEADARAEAVILEHLAPTGIPVLAEESAAAGHIPVLGERFFVVDPLDGTKEFLKRNGEFTVNIALCEDGRPVAGVVLAPATGALYWGSAGGAFEADGHRTASSVRSAPLAVDGAEPCKIVASRSHGHAALETPDDRRFGITENVSVGSSLKFCLLARGDAQLYPRFTPTSRVGHRGRPGGAGGGRRRRSDARRRAAALRQGRHGVPQSLLRRRRQRRPRRAGRGRDDPRPRANPVAAAHRLLTAPWACVGPRRLLSRRP